MTKNELELIEIGLVVAQFQANNVDDRGEQHHQALAVFSDSQIALNRVHEPLSPKTMQSLTRSIKSLLLKLGEPPVRL